MSDNLSLYNIEEYNHDLSYRYVLSDSEKKIFADIIHTVLHKFKSPKETIPYVKTYIRRLDKLYISLNDFFKSQPGNYFLRISECSPKDAWYQLCTETPSSDDESKATIDDIRRDLDVLKVNNAEQCILVLCHSLRIFYEMDSIRPNTAIILMPWKNNILHDTETRCFIKNKKLLVFSQYYCDLNDGYKSIFNIITPDMYRIAIIEYINGLILSGKIPYDNAVVDIAISTDILTDHILSNNHFIFIEINPFSDITDSCLLTWNEINNLTQTNPKFFYKVNSIISSI